MVGSSPGSPDGDDDLGADHHEKKRQPGVKRACNECRQQKVSPIPSHSILLDLPHAPIPAANPQPVSVILLPFLVLKSVNANDPDCASSKAS